MKHIRIIITGLALVCAVGLLAACDQGKVQETTKDTYGLTPGYCRMVESDDPNSELYYGYDLVATLEEWPGLPNGEILPD